MSIAPKFDFFSLLQNLDGITHNLIVRLDCTLPYYETELELVFIGGADLDLVSRLREACARAVLVIHQRHLLPLYKCAELDLKNVISHSRPFQTVSIRKFNLEGPLPYSYTLR